MSAVKIVYELSLHDHPDFKPLLFKQLISVVRWLDSWCEAHGLVNYTYERYCDILKNRNSELFAFGDNIHLWKIERRELL